MYYTRTIDQYLTEWASRPEHKPLLLRGARQVGKSTAIRHVTICPLYAISQMTRLLALKE